MKLPMDKNYFKISFYIIFVIVVSFFICRIIDSVFAVLFDFGTVFSILIQSLKTVTEIFSPIILGFVIAYILDPLVHYFQLKYEKHRKRQYPFRTAGTIIVFLLIIIFLLIFMIFMYFKIEDTDKGFIYNIFSMSNRAVNQLIEKFNQWEGIPFMNINISGIIEAIGNRINGFTNNIFDKLAAAGSFLVNFFIGTVLAFYMLRNKKNILTGINNFFSILLKEKTYKKTKNILADINYIFSAYVVGQMTDALIMSVIVSITLSVIGVEFGVLIGVITGFANLIPYVGAVLGFVLSVSAALMSGSWMKALISGIAIIIIQQIDGLYIVPKVVGEKVKLSPPTVIGALAVFGNIWGIWGMIFAVPLCAVIKKFLLRFIESKSRSEI